MTTRRYLVWFGVFGLSVLLSLWLTTGLGSVQSASSAQTDLFDAVWETVNENFYDANFNGVDWSAAGTQYRQQVAQASTQPQKIDLINQMLSELNTSHTHLFTANEPAYYQLLGIFYPRSQDLHSQLEETFPEGKIEYTGIGIVIQQKSKKTFVKAIFDGSPAAATDLKVGDEILSIEGQPFKHIESFAGKADQSVSLQVQPSLNPASQTEITVTPRIYDGLTMFLEAMEESVDIVEKAGKQIGYVHIWSYAGDQYQDSLEAALMFGRLKDTDALVLDLREGWGGAPPTALHIFTAEGPSVTNVGRDRPPFTYHSQWNKPVVLLINEGSRSAKEILAYGFKRYNIGPVVGTTTAGAVTAGRAFIMPDKSLLYVAVGDVYVDETVRLEGIGVTPDVEVPFQVEYAQGTDPQKERAIAIALQALNSDEAPDTEPNIEQ
ncbi:MAG: S41 family peptidase [Cyanobacteria bacterium J06554_11]